MDKNLPNIKIILAPMAGITDLPFRLICKEHGADIVYSEMISVAGLFYNGKKTKELLKTIPEEQPMAFQLFGTEPKHFAKATKLITNQSASQSAQLDINFGCPVKKVIKQGAGCALMEKPKLAREIIQAVLENTTLPVSIKIRAGIKKIDALNFLEKVADLNWKTVIVHGRTYENGFKGPINLELIKKIKEKFPQKNVIANGGILTPEDAKKVLKKTNVDGLAIARGTLGNPWIFEQIKSFLKTGKYKKPSVSEIKNTALRHARLFIKHKKEEDIREFRKHLGWYFKGIPKAKKIRKDLFAIESYEKIKQLIRKI